VIEEMVKIGGVPLVMSVAEFRQFLANENARWGKAVKHSVASIV
jgi:hypothetical protein